MFKHDDARKIAAKPLAWLLLVSVAALFAQTLRLQNRPDGDVARQFTEPNPVFVQAYNAALSPAE
jgi:hypothetical protein